MLPGPFQAFAVSESARRGWRPALPIALAPLLSDGPVLLLVFLVMSRLPGDVLQGMRIVGGVFVGYLAYGALRWLMRDGAQPEAGYGGVLKGAVMNLLNPNPWLFWGLVGAPIVLETWKQAPPQAVAFMVAFYGVLLAVTAGLIVVFGSAAGLGPRLRRGLLLLSALVLGGFGAYQVIGGLRHLVA